jgi:hypothetical protein
VAVQAGSLEGDSPPLRLEITWDGEWDAGETEMGRRTGRIEKNTFRVVQAIKIHEGQILDPTAVRDTIEHLKSVYQDEGYKTPSTLSAQDCGDMELLVPFGPNTPERVCREFRL